MSDENGLLEVTAEDAALEAEINAPEPEKVESRPEPEVTKEPAKEPTEARMVPITALDEQRHRYREVNEQLRQESEKRAKMEARFEELVKRLQKPEPQAPEYEKDPLGHLKHETTDVRQKLSEFEQWKSQQAEVAKRQAEEQVFVGQYQAAAADYARTNKDFPAAYQHLRESWASELGELGFSPADVAQQMLNWERGIAQKALADGANPAERIMKAAKVRGYKQVVPTANQQIETLKKGAQAAKSLSSAGGDVEPPDTLEALSEMDGADFDKAFERIVNKGRSRGGLGGFFN